MQPSFARAKKIFALVPKSGRKSLDDESSAESGNEQEEFQVSWIADSDSSSPPSLPSSLENLNLLSDEEIVPVQEAVSESPLQPSPLTPLSQQNQPQSPAVLPSPRSLPNVPQSPAIPLSPATPVSSTRSRARQPRLVLPHRQLARPKMPPLNFRWTQNKFTHKAEITANNFPDEIPKTPYEYFTTFLTNDILEYVTEQTNLYSTQETGKSLNISVEDIKDFVAINLLMGIVDMPAYTDYWSRELRYSLIADVMTLKKFQQLRRYIHFNNNLLDDGDRYFKIRPFVEKLRANFLKIPHEDKFSIDEMMVPYKGKKAGNRKQYVKNKPKKWGYKIFVRAGVSGFVYDFLIYGGEDTFRLVDLSPLEMSFGLGAKVVLALCKTIPDPACKVVYFDNFFTSLELINYLREELGIFSLGTIRTNRLRGAEKKLPTDKELKKKPRGSHSQVVCNSNKVSVVKWYDNKCVTTASSYVDAHPVSTILRYDKEKKRRTAVPCPEIIKHYNAHMGGVDLADMLIALYRTGFKGHRWYLPLVSQLLDICVTNSWILYRRHHKHGKTMSLKKFRFNIVQNLLLHERPLRRQPAEVPGPTSSKLIKAPVAARPPTEVRYDQLDHFPVFGTKGRCKLCTKGQSTVSCAKCNVRLCLFPNRNCFFCFHKQ